MSGAKAEWSVTGYDYIKRDGVAALREPFQDLTFRQCGDRPGLEKPLELANNGLAFHERVSMRFPLRLFRTAPFRRSHTTLQKKNRRDSSRRALDSTETLRCRIKTLCRAVAAIL